MHTMTCRWRVALLIVALVVTVPAWSLADGILGAPETTVPLGTFRGIEYVQHTGWFESVAGDYRVPYQITAPAKPCRGNGRLVLEPPHFALPAPVRDWWLTPEFLFGRGFSHAQVGWGAFGYQILDPAALASGEAWINAPPATCGGDFCPETTNFEIVADFAEALKSSPVARALLRRLRRIYATGNSNSTEPVHALLHSARGQGLFDLSFLLVTPVGLHAIPPEGHEPPAGAGRIVLLSAEADLILFGATGLRDPDPRHPWYRMYEVAGAPHIANTAAPPRLSPLGNDPTPFARGLFTTADRWVTRGRRPPPSQPLTESTEMDPVYGFLTGIARDGDGNALGGVRAPDLEVGRYQYLAVDFGF